MVWPKPRPPAGRHLAALLTALAAHLAVLYGVAREAPHPMAGGHGRLLDAVNITLVNSAVLEARQDVSAPPAPASADAVEAKQGTVENKRGPQHPEQKEEKRAPEKQPEKPVPPQVAEAPSVVKPQEEMERKKASTSADAGGAEARGDVPNAAKRSAPAAASPGAVSEYEHQLNQAFIAAKPKSAGVGRRGTVRIMIRLRISTAGEITSVEIAKSSGNKRLDDLALAAAQRTKVPLPPAGMTADRLFYLVPYDFDFR